MTIRTRKLIGTFGLLGLAASKLAQAIFYVVAGLGWVLPAMPLIAWMSRPDPQP